MGQLFHKPPHNNDILILRLSLRSYLRSYRVDLQELFDKFHHPFIWYPVFYYLKRDQEEQLKANLHRLWRWEEIEDQDRAKLFLDIFITLERFQLNSIPELAEISALIPFLKLKLAINYDLYDTLFPGQIDLIEKFNMNNQQLISVRDMYNLIEENYVTLRKGDINKLITANCIRTESYSNDGVDIVAFDHNLVSDDPYLDGSFISLHKKRYLALHVPRDTTTAFFYKVLVDNGVRLIVNLTEPTERANKNFQYWPNNQTQPQIWEGRYVHLTVKDREVHKERVTVQVSVKLLDEKDFHPKSNNNDGLLEYVTVRRLFITVKENSRTREHILFQLHMRNWEDQFVPNLEVLRLSLSLVNQLNAVPEAQTERRWKRKEKDISSPFADAETCFRFPKKHPNLVLFNDQDYSTFSFQPSSNDEETRNVFHSLNEGYDPISKSLNEPPIALHCHSGVGRTGTFMLIHSLLSYINTLEGSFNFNIIRSLVLLRLQRESVQGGSQLTFVYSSLCQLLKDKLKMKDGIEENNNNRLDDQPWLETLSQFDRTQNSCRIAAYLDSFHLLEAEKIEYQKTHPIKNAQQLDAFFLTEAFRIQNVLFESLTNEETTNWTNRLLKSDKNVIAIIKLMMEKNVSLEKLNEFMKCDRNRPQEICSNCTAYHLLFNGNFEYFQTLLNP